MNSTIALWLGLKLIVTNKFLGLSLGELVSAILMWIGVVILIWEYWHSRRTA